MNVQMFRRPITALVAAFLIAIACAIALLTPATHADSAAASDVQPSASPPPFEYPPASSDTASAAGHAAFAQRFALLRGGGTVALASMVIKDPGIDRTAGRQLSFPPAAALARTGVAPAEGRAWIAPRYDGSMCLLPKFDDAQGPAETCASADEAASGQLLMTLSRSDDDVDLYGLAPDGVDQVVVHLADGSTSVVPVVDNAYAAHFSQPTAGVSVGGREIPLRSDG